MKPFPSLERGLFKKDAKDTKINVETPASFQQEIFKRKANDSGDNLVKAILGLKFPNKNWTLRREKIKRSDTYSKKCHFFGIRFITRSARIKMILMALINASCNLPNAVTIGTQMTLIQRIFTDIIKNPFLSARSASSALPLLLRGNTPQLR